MTLRDWFGNVWPSLLAFVGTVAVVVALLVVIGGDIKSDDSDGLPGGDDIVAAETETPPATPASTQTPEPAGPQTASPEQREPVRVLNATSVTGLARRTADRLRAGGWEVTSIGDYSSKEEVTTVHYPEGFEEAAEALRAQFPEIAEVAPRTGRMRSDQLTLVLGSDYAEATEASGEAGDASG